MDNLTKSGQRIFAIGIAGLGVICFIMNDFIIGRPPKWPADVNINPGLAYITGTIVILSCIAIFINKKGAAASLLIAVFIFVLSSMLRHLPNFMNDWVNGYKSLALTGGALIVAGSFLRHEKNIIGGLNIPEGTRSALVMVGTIFVAMFFISAGYAHFKWAQGVKELIPAFIPFRLFWTYFCGGCLIAGGIGILIPSTRKLAALLSGIMVLGFFLLLHIPRFIANPADLSDRMGVCESFAVVGIFFALAGMEYDRKR